MDNLAKFIRENLLLLALCGAVLLSFILFLFYLRCILKSYIVSRARTLPLTSSQELPNSQLSSSTEGDLETETILMMPHQGSASTKTGEMDGLSLHFFRLPSDKRKSYYRFRSVDDDLADNEFTVCYKPTCSRPVAYHGRKGDRRLSRKGTWDKRLHILIENTMDHENTEREGATDSIIPLISCSIQNETSIFQTFGAKNKETLI